VGRSLRAARRRAGLSQRGLARRSGVAQPTIARIETGLDSPRLTTLTRLLDECGDALEVVARLGDGIDRTQIRLLLALAPADRLAGLAEEAPTLERLDRARRLR